MAGPSELPDAARADDAATRRFRLVVTAAVVLAMVRLGQEFLIPLVVATLLFTLALAITERIEALSIGGWKPPRWLAYLFGIGLVFLGFLALGTAASSQADAIVQAAPHYAERLQALAGKAKDLVGEDIVSALQRAVSGINVGAWLSSVINSVGGALGNIFLVLLYVLFMAAERGAFRRKLPLLCAGEAEAARLAVILRFISARIQDYIWINSLTSALSAIVAFVILKVIGVPFATTLALVIFVFNFIPGIGSIIGVALMALMALLQFDTLTPFIVVLVVYGGADAIVANLIAPALQGKSLNLSPLMVMVSLAFWGFMWGTVGTFLAVPLTVATMIVCAEFAPLRPLAALLSSDGQTPRPDFFGDGGDA